MSVKVVFFGSIGIARRILENIILKKDVELLGVCCEQTINDWRGEESVFHFVNKNRIPILSLENISGLSADLGISVRFHKIIPENVISSFRLGIVNTHGGILPEYRGSYCNINAILNDEKEYGVTLHYIQPGVDDGDIVDIRKIAVNDDSTGFELYRESERLCFELVEENIDALLAGINQKIPQQLYIHNGHRCNLYKRDHTIRAKDLTDINIYDPLWLRTVRAFDSPYHEPAYIRLGDKKIYVRFRFGSEGS